MYPSIIGITGYAQNGKDSIGDVLIEHFGYTRIALADPLKEMARAIGWNGTKDDGPPCKCCGMLQGRPLLQKMGTEAIRNHLGPDIWVRNVLRLMEYDKRYVITDVRFPNEASILHQNGARIWRVYRDGFGVGKNHASEASIDEIYQDTSFFNNGSLEDLEKVVLDHMKYYDM